MSKWGFQMEDRPPSATFYNTNTAITTNTVLTNKVTTKTNQKAPKPPKRSKSMMRSPSFGGAEKWSWWRRKKSSVSDLAAMVGDDGSGSNSTSGGGIMLQRMKLQRRKSMSLTSLDNVDSGFVSESPNALGSLDNLDDNCVLFQKSTPDTEYQLWVRSGKDETPYPLIGELFN